MCALILLRVLMRIKYFWRTCCFSVSVSLKLSVCVCEHVQSHCLILARWFSEILQGCILAGSVTIYLILQGSKDTTTPVIECVCVLVLLCVPVFVCVCLCLCVCVCVCAHCHCSFQVNLILQGSKDTTRTMHPVTKSLSVCMCLCSCVCLCL